MPLVRWGLGRLPVDSDEQMLLEIQLGVQMSEGPFIIYILRTLFYQIGDTCMGLFWSAGVPLVT